jgi:hypothetical protein
LWLAAVVPGAKARAVQSIRGARVGLDSKETLISIKDN